MIIEKREMEREREREREKWMISTTNASRIELLRIIATAKPKRA